MLQLPPDQVDVEKVVELVSYDGTIAAHCLRMANSPLFGRRNTETVRSAVLALGLKRVEAILLGCCLNGIVPPDKWAVDAVTFWRHSLGCALVSSKLAKLIGYPDPEKAYLAGLLHDVGILVNTLACTEDFRRCIQAARDGHVALHRSEAEHLGFTHSQSGKILAEHWHFSGDVMEVIEFHHDVVAAPAGGPLVSLVHLSDLLCRLRDLGYGYYEAMGVDFAGDSAWATLVEHYPALANMDLARLTMDIDGAMEEIVAIVDAVFNP
jgi:HD-like signal output (HDOD) protein